MTPKWALPATQRFKRSQKNERRVAQALGGRELPRSGGMKAAGGADSPTLEGDFRTPTLHAEHKRTEKPELRVQREWFRKVSSGAARCHRTPAVVLLLEPVQGDAREWIFLPVGYARSAYQQLLADPAGWDGEVVEPKAASFLFRASAVEPLVRRLGAAFPVILLTWPGAEGFPAEWLGAPLSRAAEALRSAL